MTTAPIDIVRTTATSLRRQARSRPAYFIARAAGALLWLDALLAIVVVALGYRGGWVVPVVLALLAIGGTALAVFRLRLEQRRLDAILTWLLGR